MNQSFFFVACLLAFGARCYGSTPESIVGMYRGTLSAASGPLQSVPESPVAVTLAISKDPRSAGRYLSQLTFGSGAQLLTDGQFSEESSEFEDEESVGPKEASALVALTCKQAPDRSLDCSYQSLSTGHGYRFHLVAN